MEKSKKNSKTSRFEMTAEQLGELEKDTLVNLLVNMHEQYQQLSELMQSFMREKYGPKTDRYEDPGQMRLFEGAQSKSDDAVQASEPEQLPTKKKRKSREINPRPANLERIERRGAEPNPEELQCLSCDLPRKLANEVSRGDRLVYEPAKIHIEDFIASIYACVQCGNTVVVEPPITSGELKVGADPGLQALIAVERFEDSLPLNRQERRFYRLGVPIARSTMCGWLRASSISLRPLYDRMKTLLLQSKWVATDDTSMKVQDRSKETNIKLARFWIYRGDDEHPVNIFDYTTGRGRDGPLTFLRNFRGYLLGDCFSGNLAVCAETGSTLVACNAHARRYFIKAQTNNKAKCAEILNMYRELFKIERDAKELGVCGADLKLMREQESKPLLQKMKVWLDEQSVLALPKSSFGKAVQYALNNWTELTNYLHDGDLAPDNNLAEQEMKRVAINRKNSLFFGSDDGAEDAEVFMSLISTCRRHDVEPWAYLRDLIDLLSKDPDHDLDSLLPHNWKKLSGKTEFEPSFALRT